MKSVLIGSTLGEMLQVPEFDTDGNVIGTNITYPNVLTGNTRTLSGAHSPTGTSRDTLVRTQSGTSTGSTTTLSSPSDLRIPNPIPNLPGKIGIGAGVSPILTSPVTNKVSKKQEQVRLLEVVRLHL